MRVRVVVVVLVMVAIAVAAWAVLRTPRPIAPAAAAVEHKHGDEAAVAQVPRTAVPELAMAMQRGDVVVLDVRDIDSYVGGHITGALHIPLSYIESELPYLKDGRKIVTYCT